MMNWILGLIHLRNPRGVRGAAPEAIDFPGISVLDIQFPGISEMKSGADIRLIFGLIERDNHGEKNGGEYISTCSTLIYVRQKEEFPCFSQQYQGNSARTFFFRDHKK